jgi:TetR/AcrR family transcriptional regulator, regulator of biofilm formation and stress response
MEGFMGYVLIDERRARLIAATAKVIHEHGIGNATTRRIAEEAGASLASLHYTFSNKEDLFVATMKALSERGQQEVATSVSEGMGVADAAAAIVNAYIDWIRSSMGNQIVEYELHLWAHRRPDLSHLPGESFAAWVDFIRELLDLGSSDSESNVATDSLARAVLALIDGFNLQSQLFNDDMADLSREAATNALRHSVENGCFAKPVLV